YLEIIQFAAKAGLDVGVEEDLAAVIENLGTNGRLQLSEFGLRRKQEHEAIGREQLERAELIAEITRGKEAFPIWSPAHGKAKQVASSSLEQESTENLRAIAAGVTAYRAARDGKASTINPSQMDNTEGVSAGYKPTGQQQQLSQLQAQNAPADLIDPKTGARYTRSAVLQLIKTDVNAFRALKNQNWKQLDEILAGR